MHHQSKWPYNDNTSNQSLSEIPSPVGVLVMVAKVARQSHWKRTSAIQIVSLLLFRAQQACLEGNEALSSAPPAEASVRDCDAASMRCVDRDMCTF